MFTLTKAQAKAIQELNWVNIDEHDDEQQALYQALGTRKLDRVQLACLDMDFVVDRAKQELEDCQDYGEPCDRIGHQSRLRSMQRLAKKLDRWFKQHMQQDELDALDNPPAQPLFFHSDNSEAIGERVAQRVAHRQETLRIPADEYQVDQVLEALGLAIRYLPGVRESIKATAMRALRLQYDGVSEQNAVYIG